MHIDSTYRKDFPLASEEDLIAAAKVRFEIAILAHAADNDKSRAMTEEGDSSRILELLGQLPPSVPAKEFVRHGFQMLYDVDQADIHDLDRSTYRRPSSLADAMLSSGKIDVLKTIVAGNKLDINIDDLCCFCVSFEKIEYKTLAAIAASLLSPEALKLALNLNPGTGGRHPSIPAEGPYDGGLPLLHHMVLSKAVISMFSETSFDAAECASIFIENGIQVKSETGSLNPVATTLLGASWFDERAPHLLGLLRKYHESGQLDLDRPLDKSSLYAAGLRPLEASIKFGNLIATKELMDLGCDVSGVLKASNSKDLVTLIQGETPCNQNEMIACVTAGLMEREINDARPAGAAASADASNSPAELTVARRARRASI